MNSEITEEKIDNRNVLEKFIVKKYAELFKEAYYASIFERDIEMQSIVDMVVEDKTIINEMKRKISKLCLAYNQAGFNESFNGPLVMFINRNSVNYNKYINKNRISRIVDDLYLLRERFEGYEFNVKTVFDLSTYLIAPYNTKEREGIELYLPILLAMYSRRLNPNDYTNMYFIVMIIKNISDLAFFSPASLSKYPVLKKRRENMISFILKIYNIYNGKH